LEVAAQPTLIKSDFAVAQVSSMITGRTLQQKVEDILVTADIRIRGDRPWDLIVFDDRFYKRVISHGALGLGESYMDGWWDCANLSELFTRLLTAHLDRWPSIDLPLILVSLQARLANRQSRARASKNVRHYDLGNDLYRSMLGRWMLYSSANWQRAVTLDEAAEAKFDSVCRRLNLCPGQRILDIGCGWGGFAKYAAQKYGVHVVGITVSSEQEHVAREVCGDLPVEIRHQDYRELELQDKFDHVVSLGMFEHVGHKNYRRYMEIVHHCLKPNGLFLLNTIGTTESGYFMNTWTDRYIFPGSTLPSIAQIGAAIDGLFAMEELQDCAEFYDKTLMSWFENFRANWNKIKSHYSDQFYRMWKYYLLSSAGAFRSRTIQDWQIVLLG
jgi:cyclopropane-fatty-acyl-phospholipid synthase